MIVRSVLAAAAIVLGAGCTTIREVYPKFKEQSAAMRAVAITTDVMVLEDVKGPLPLVDIPRDIALAESLGAYLKAGLEERGVTVVSTDTSSVGLRHSSSVTPPIKIRAAGEATDLPVEKLTTATAPFHVAPGYTNPAQRSALQNIFEDIRRYSAAPGVPNLTSRYVRQLAPVSGTTHRIFVLVEGVQVPPGKGLGQAVLTGLLTLGAASSFEMTSVSFRIGIADVATGEFILIEDCTIAGGWSVDDAYLHRQAGIFLAHFSMLRK